MELLRFPSRGGFSVRSILTFALTVIITALLWTTFSSSPSHAVTAGETATWQNGGATLVFDKHSYEKTTELADTSGTIPSGAEVYQSPVQNAASSSDKKIFVLFFSPGVDPPAATTATYVELTYNNNGTVSNPKDKQDVPVETPSADGESGSSCSVTGIGWIVCPVSVFLAEAMDSMFEILSGFISVQPSVLGDPNNSMYIAWNVMRNIANIAFVIAFIIIIYSQLTSLGVSNYGIKKLIPRLIIAAVLVNISFFIAALAIDASNILGYSIQDVFNTIREQTFHLTNDNVSGLNTNVWGAVTAAVLAGGGIVGGVFYMSSGGLYLLVPLLVGLLLTVIFVLLVLAARQAIIIILVIIAPLAFVANLLPNTEKWFDKWKDLFFTMLIFFPAFSLVFGGSQLAGQIIIQNAGGDILTLIFGLAVQIAPLVITPLILKLSGSLLGRIAQIANNPRKGVIDRSRNWGERRAEHAKQQNMARGARWYNPASYGAGMVRRVDQRKRRLSDNTDIWKQKATNRYEDSKKYEDIYERKEEAETQKNAIHSRHAAHADRLRTQTGHILNTRTVEAEEAKVSAERASAQTSAMVSAYRAGVYNTDGNERLANLQSRMAENVIQTAAWKQSEQESQYLQQRSISSRMRNDDGLLDIAKGYGSPEFQVIARERAQANAVATITKLNKDARENAITLMETEAVEAGVAVKDYAIKNVFSAAKSADATIRSKVSPSRLEAALEIAAADGQVTVFDDARSSEFVDQTIVDAVVARNVGNMKSKGGFHIQANPQLSLQRYIEDFNNGKRSESSIDEVRASFAHDLKLARLSTLSNTNSANLGGVKYGAFAQLAEDLTSSDPNKNLLNAIPLGPDNKPANKEDAEMVARIFESLRDGLSDPSTRATMTDRLKFARAMEETIRERFYPERLPIVENVVQNGETPPAGRADPTSPPAPDVNPTDESPSEDNN